MKTLELKSNEGIILSFLGWGQCRNQILQYESCKMTGSIALQQHTKCAQKAKQLQLCYSNKSLQIEPLCLPILNDTRECLFKADSHIINCKEQINQLVYCNKNPQQYIQFLKMSTPYQKLPKNYDFTLNWANYDYN